MAETGQETGTEGGRNRPVDPDREARLLQHMEDEAYRSTLRSMSSAIPYATREKMVRDSRDLPAYEEPDPEPEIEELPVVEEPEYLDPIDRAERMVLDVPKPTPADFRKAKENKSKIRIARSLENSIGYVMVQTAEGKPVTAKDREALKAVGQIIDPQPVDPQQEVIKKLEDIIQGGHEWAIERERIANEQRAAREKPVVDAWRAAIERIQRENEV